MQWYYSKNGTQLGPVPQGELQAKLASGEVSPSDLVWREGQADWLPASQVAELRVESATSYASPPVSLDKDAPYTQPAANPVPQAPQGYPAPVVADPGKKANTAMILGIVGLALAVLCSCLGLPCSIIAIVFGTQFKKEAETNPALAPFVGKAKSAVLMGWIGIGVAIIMMIVGVLINMSTMQNLQHMQPPAAP